MKKTISHHMTELPHTIGDEATIHKARELMREFSYHHLPVLHGGQVVGMITERDLRVAEALKKDEEVLVREVMNDEPLFVEPDQNIKEVLEIMLKKGYSSVLIRGTKTTPWGVFTTTDAIRLLMAVM